MFQMDGNDITVMGTMVAVLLGLTEVIKALVHKVLNKKNGDSDNQKEEERDKRLTKSHEDQFMILRQISKGIEELVRIHASVEHDGVSAWYTIRNIECAAKDLSKSITDLRSICHDGNKEARDSRKAIEMITSEVHELLLRTKYKKTSGEFPQQK